MPKAPEGESTRGGIIPPLVRGGGGMGASAEKNEF